MKTKINLNDISGLKKDPSGYLEMIYQNYRDEGMHWMMNKYKCNENDAKEIVQDAVVQLYENVASGKLTNLTSSIKTYLFSICKYKYFEYQRGQRKHIGSMEYLVEIPDVDDSEAQMEYESKINKIKQAMEAIGAQCSEILSRFYYHKESMLEIAKELDYKNAETVRNQKYKCLNRLRKLI